MDLNLTGRNALIGGGSRGIGKAIALELAGLGANITLLARTENELKATVSELNTAQGQAHHYIAIDFSNPERLKQAVEDHLRTHQKAFHILVNNTGGPPPGKAIDAKTDEFIRGFSNHVICNQILVQSLVEGMKTSGYGRIINIISTSVKVPIRELGVSNTVRGAVANWAKTLAFELGPSGITVNNILPGFTKTERLEAIISGHVKRSGKSREEVADFMKSLAPLHRFAEPQEIAAAAAFLASPAAAYITGINLPVDGGRTECL